MRNNSNSPIDWEAWSLEITRRAKEFMNADESERMWTIGGEIMESAVICNAWNDDIKALLEWVAENGRGLQPKIANEWLERKATEV